tara:strand:- start:11 stop:454 length:444 start_codon:yes stop_codon:yes gene_type:complete
MGNHNKIRPVNKNDLSGKYKILFSKPQSKNTKIPIKFQGLQVYNDKKEAKVALKERIKLTEILKEKNRKLMMGNDRALGNKGGDQSNLIQNDPEVQRLKNEKIKLAKKLLKKGYTKAETHRAIIAEFKLERSLDSGFPRWLSKIDNQ